MIQEFHKNLATRPADMWDARLKASRLSFSPNDSTSQEFIPRSDTAITTTDSLFEAEMTNTKDPHEVMNLRARWRVDSSASFGRPSDPPVPEFGPVQLTSPLISQLNGARLQGWGDLQPKQPFYERKSGTPFVVDRGRFEGSWEVDESSYGLVGAMLANSFFLRSGTWALNLGGPPQRNTEPEG